MKRKLFAFLLALSLALSLLPAAAMADETAEKEQIYWAVVDTNSDSTPDKLVISSALYTLAEGETLASETDRGSFDYDARFSRGILPWKYETYPNITTAVVLANADGGKMVAPVNTRAWFDQANIDRKQKLVSVDLSGLSGERLENMCVMFQYAKQLETVNFPANFDTSHVTDMSYMFNYCEKLQTVNVSGWDMSNVERIEWMFDHCLKVNNLDTSRWNITSKITNLQRMFEYCNSLETLDVSNWDVSNVTNMDRLFGNCWKLKVIDVSRWNTSSCTNMQRMFEAVNSVGTLDVSGWDTSKVTTMYGMFGHIHGAMTSVAITG